jgi:cysteine-rich repeat protein
VTVRLLDEAGDIVDETMTNDGGAYSLLANPGQHSLLFFPPQPYVFVRQDQGSDDTVDSDADPATGETEPFAVLGASVDTTRDAGLSACGNTILDSGEQCDDGNLQAGDGCSPTCALEGEPPEPPDCRFAHAKPWKLWPPKHELLAVSIEGVCDAVGDGSVEITIDAIHQDEPIEGNGDGHTCPDGAGIGTHTALLRAERQGGGDGRVYHVAFTAADASGQTCNGIVKVCVPHHRYSGCKDQGPLYDSTGPCTTIFADGLESGVLGAWSEVAGAEP